MFPFYLREASTSGAVGGGNSNYLSNSVYKLLPRTVTLLRGFGGLFQKHRGDLISGMKGLKVNLVWLVGEEHQQGQKELNLQPQPQRGEIMVGTGVTRSPLGYS
tara:strand:- start:8239 stop:8550 length:312 start_codon:yes stop_codon:yes gene_type:complete